MRRGKKRTIMKRKVKEKFRTNLEQKDQGTIGKRYLRYSTRRTIHMAALQTRKLVGLTVGLPVSVRCILTLFARHFLAMCPCSVCVPTFHPSPSPFSSRPHRVYAYIYTSSQESVNPRRIFFSLIRRLVFLPRFACCFCVVLDAWFISNVSNVFYIPWPPSSSISVSYSELFEISVVGNSSLSLKIVAFCVFKWKNKTMDRRESPSNQFPT